MKKHLYIAIGAVLLAGAIVLALWLKGASVTFSGDKADRRIYVPTGSSYSDLCDTLKAHGCMPNPTAFNLFARLRKLPDHVKGGSYIVSDGMTALALVGKLNSGNQDAIRLTVGKHRTLESLCDFLGQKLEFSSDSLLTLLRDKEVCASLGETPQTVIGLFPRNTYEIYWTTSPLKFLQRMKHESDVFWSSRQASLQALTLTRQQVITLASIVEEETNANEEKADIASVYLNRLRIGMPLQADPTVKYALGDFTIRRILNYMLQVDSPYNTYRNTGLPPGPICIPSQTSIDAVLKNKKTSWIYFCAKEDFSGRHNFSSSLAEHQRNAARFHKALNDRKIH